MSADRLGEIYAEKLPAVQQSTTDKPVLLPDIDSLIYYVGGGLCAPFLLCSVKYVFIDFYILHIVT